MEGKLIGALLTFLRGRNIAKRAVCVVQIFIYPGINKKTKINAHELEALRFILRFLLWPLRTHREHTHRQGRATASQRQAGQSRGQGRVHALRLRLAACLHPRALRASTPGSSARGRAQRPGHFDFWQQTRIQKFATCFRQVRLVCVCVCARANTSEQTLFLLSRTQS